MPWPRLRPAEAGVEQRCIPGRSRAKWVVSTEPAPPTELEVRAAAGKSTFQDRRALFHARALRDGLRTGKTIVSIAAELGDISRSALSRFSASPLYAAACRALDAGALTATPAKPADEESALEAARLSLAERLPDAMTYIETCFLRDESKPARPYLDEGRAMWATQLVLKSAGLADAKQGGGAPPVVITADAMNVMLGAIRGDDQKRLPPPPAITVTAEVAR